MSKLVTIENTGVGGFGLPTGQVIAGRTSIVVEPEVWDASKEHPVVAALVKDGTLIIDGKGKKKSATDDRDENGDPTHPSRVAAANRFLVTAALAPPRCERDSLPRACGS